MNAQEQSFTAGDIEKLKKQMARNKTSLISTAALCFVLSLVLPFLPPKYKNGKAMLDLMSYPEAAAGILFVFGIVLAWYYFFSIYRLKRDIREGVKINLQTKIVKKSTLKRRSVKYFYITAQGLPSSLRNVPVDENEYNSFSEGDMVIIEYSKRTAEYLGFRRVL